MIQLINPSESTLNVGNANISIEAPTSSTKKPFRGDRDTDVNLPAGAYEIFVQHIDPSGGTITVNGEALSFNGIYSSEAEFDRPANRQDFVEAVAIVATNKKYALRVSYPSDHPFDPSTL